MSSTNNPQPHGKPLTVRGNHNKTSEFSYYGITQSVEVKLDDGTIVAVSKDYMLGHEKDRGNHMSFDLTNGKDHWDVQDAMREPDSFIQTETDKHLNVIAGTIDAIKGFFTDDFGDALIRKWRIKHSNTLERSFPVSDAMNLLTDEIFKDHVMTKQEAQAVKQLSEKIQAALNTPLPKLPKGAIGFSHSAMSKHLKNTGMASDKERDVVDFANALVTKLKKTSDTLPEGSVVTEYGSFDTGTVQPRKYEQKIAQYPVKGIAPSSLEIRSLTAKFDVDHIPAKDQIYSDLDSKRDNFKVITLDRVDSHFNPVGDTVLIIAGGEEKGKVIVVSGDQQVNGISTKVTDTVEALVREGLFDKKKINITEAEGALDLRKKIAGALKDKETPGVFSPAEENAIVLAAKKLTETTLGK